MALYIGTNYHPHDWSRERWRKDIQLMQEAGFTTVRLGHLCWDSYESEEGVYTFEWFDEVMNLFAEAGIGVLLDISMRPAPVWVHKLCQGCNIYDKDSILQPSIRRYMEDIADPGYRYYALRFAERLVNRYKEHPALFAFGLCNEIGDGFRNYSEVAKQRFIWWLKKKYHTVDSLNQAWATRRWSRKLTSFEDVVFPETEVAAGSPEAWLDMRRFFSDGISEFMILLKECVEKNAPGIPHSSNHYAEKDTVGFDYMKFYEKFVDYPGMGVYAGYQIEESFAFNACIMHERIAETNKPMWCLEFQTGGGNLLHGPYGALRATAMLCLLYRSQMILGWTWRSMTAGEEQYLEGLVGHDGIPSVNYKEYKWIAQDLKKLEKYAFPYLPQPDIGVAYSFDADWVMQYSKNQYQHTYLKNMTQVQKAFFKLNRDYNIVNLKAVRNSYKVLILPEYVLMTEEEAEIIRGYVKDGGIVIMTAHSSVVDEHNQVFSIPRPGYLTDVFGIRVAGFDRTNCEWDFTEQSKIVETDGKRHELLRISAENEFWIDVNYYEKLELSTAKEVVSFADKGKCAISENIYGEGKAYYIAAEMNAPLLVWLLEKISVQNGLKEGLRVPDGIHAREITENQTFYVNGTGREIRIPLKKSGKGVLSELNYKESLVLKPYDVELIVG